MNPHIKRNTMAESIKNITSSKVTVTIDGQDIEVPMGTTILDAATQLGIDIPTLCAHPDLEAAGLCRICVVEVEGWRTLQASCAFPITQPMKVHTHTRKVRQARRQILELLLSKHYGDCYTCNRNGNCELRTLAMEYGVDSLPFGAPKEPAFVVDNSSYSIVRDMNKCILCRRCVRTCMALQDVGCLTVANRSNQSFVTTFMDKPLGGAVCINCGQCVNRCPTGALQAVDQTDEIWAAIDDPQKHVVIQTAPAPRAAIGECFGVEPGHAFTFEMNTALRECGFDGVFDTNFTADLT
ncbi:MAG: 2Fe-2S iron-sulfur cluster binding domain-containing protein, partial [Chloroflexi bacterium]|nr:2Fe-2S iron-sulfur cluster binding domain-containing protein [Chloroflexota bacterium]